jgi:competence protein ComEC
MSFAAVAALIAGAPLLRRAGGDGRYQGFAWRMVAGLAFWMVASVATTLLATAATSPFAAFHFHQISPYGILGNAIALPVMELLVMPASVLGVFLLPFGLDAPVWWLTGKGAAGVLAMARWIAEIPGARLAVPGLGMPAMLLFASGFMVLVLFATRLRYLGLPLVIAATAVAARPQVPDLWIDRRGDAVAVKGSDGALQVFGPGVSAFTLSNWLPASGDERLPGDPTLAGGARCDRQGCTAAMADGRWLALVREPPAFEEDCRRAAVIVTPLVAPAWCKPALALIDYRFLARHGATLATLDGDKLSVETSRGESMNRPWWPAFQPFRSGSAGKTVTDAQ